MKLIFLKLLAVVAAGSLFVVALLVFRPAGEQNFAKGQASIAEAFPLAPSSERILLQGPGGGVWVNNFYKTAKAAIPESGAVLVSRAAGYDILYYRADSGFEIAMDLSASSAGRSAAENSLFAILGAGKQELCKLKISISSLASDGDREYVPLSFCQSVFRTQ